MRTLRLFVTLIIVLIIGQSSYSQDFSNKGKEFWLAYSYHVGMVNGGNAPAMTLYITADVATTYTVEIYGVTTIASGSIAAFQVIPVTIPNTYFISTDGLTTGRTIRVTAVKPVVVYSFITRSQASAATLALPSNVLGKEYYASCFTGLSNEANSRTYITIVAAEDNTTVEITPTQTTVGGWAAGSTNNINLNKGEIYQVLGTTPTVNSTSGVDLSGTRIKSVASGGGGGCKKIAVFSGNGKVSINTPSCTGSSADNLYQQLYPISSWGKKYLTVPSSGRLNNHYRIYRSDPTSNVFLNGVLIPAASFTNNYYQFYNNTPNNIESDIPVSVSQYFPSQNCPTSQNPYDPDMIVLNPVEQNIKDVTLVSSPLTVSPALPNQPHQHHIHVIMKDDPPGGTGRSSFRFDNAVPTATWLPHPNQPGYSYLYLSNIAAGNHRIKSDSGFNAVAYGYGSAETYGYSAGANVRDLYQQIGVASQFGIEQSPSVCKGSPFKFKVSLPYCATSLQWDLSQLPGPPAPPPTQNFSTCTPGAGGPDSTTIVNGVTLYWYSLPNTYTFNTAGAFAVGITVQKPNTDGCGNQQEIDFELNVYDPPIADFSWTGGGCVAEPVSFFDETATPRPSYIWNWTFTHISSNTITTSTVQNPTVNFSQPGAYNVKFSTITTPGCISQEVDEQIIIPEMPSATISGAETVCVNGPQPIITFTGMQGKPPYTFTYNINNGPNQIISTSGNNTSVTLNAPTNVVGTFRYNLTEIKNTGSTLCVSPINSSFVDITVNANTGLALSSGSANQALCQNTPIANIVYTISGGGTNAAITGPALPAGLTGNYNSATKQFTISGTPTTPGVYNFTVEATGLCLPNQLTGTITVNPDATITNNTVGNETQSLCINTPISGIIYSITGGGTGATVTGLPPGVAGVYAGGVFTITGNPTATGTFNYTVQTTGTCLQKTTTGVITVNPDATLTLTSAAATTSQSLCQDIAIANITYAIGGGGTNATITGLPTGINFAYNAGVLTISGASPTPGTYNYTIQTSGTCVQRTATGMITITPDAAITLNSAAATNAQELCKNAAITNITYDITGGGTGGTVTGLPAGVNGVFNAGVFTISGTPSVAGTFNYTVQTTGTCVQKTAIGTIIVNELPTASFTTPMPRCATRVINFSNTSVPNSGNITTWVWNFGDASPPVTINAPASPNVSHIYAAANNYNVNLTVTTDKGCVSTNPATPITITNRPTPGFIIPEVCINDVATLFTDTSRVAGGETFNPTGYFWNFGDLPSGANNTATTVNGTHLYTAIGPYPVWHVVTTAAGCKDTASGTIFINAADPVSDFNIVTPTTLCSNDSISLINRSTISQGSVTKLDIYWDVTGAPATFETIDVPVFNGVYKHKYPTLQTTRTYRIRLVAYSGAICLTNKEIPITVNAAPRVQFLPMSNVCFDAAPFQITTASELGGVAGTPTYSGNGVSASGLFTPSSVIPGSTNTIKYLYASTAAGCKDSATQTITVWDTASARIALAAITCEKNAISFNSNASTIPAGASSITGFNWNFGDPGSGANNTSTNASPNHTYNGWGNYNVTLQVRTSNNCRSTFALQPITVNPLPRPNFTKPASACLPAASIQFNIIPPTMPDGSIPVGYLWDFDDPASGANNTATSSSPTHIYNTAGPFNVNLEVTSDKGCLHDTTIVINTIHPQPIADFTIDKTEVCVGGSFSFTDNTNYMDGTAASWNWTLKDGNTRTTRNFTHTYTTAQTFDVELFAINSHGCRSTTAIKPVTVHPFPVVDAGPDRLLLEGGQITLQPVVTGNDLSYLWTPNRYITGSNTIKNLVVNGVDDIRYLLTVTARGNCSDTSSVFIKVLKFPAVPNIFSPNGDGVHDTWKIDYLDTYPGSTVEIYNRYGQMIFRSVGYIVPWDGTVNGKPVPVGTYYYIVDPKNGRKLMTGYVDVIR